MSDARPFLSTEAARAAVVRELDVIDAALDRLRATSTDMVGNAFRVQVVERLETQHRLNRGLSYRLFGEMADPPDGDERPVTSGPGVRLRDVLASPLHLTTSEVRRRFRVAARLTVRRSLIGTPLPPELPALADAVESGAVGEDHIHQVCKAI